MSFIPIIEAGIGLAREILKYASDLEKRKYSDELVKLQKKRLKETSKPLDQQNDALIENIDKQIIIIYDMAKEEIKAYVKNATGTQPD